ncbi:pro-sigmaK processing inhibitor BofA family protein [uncultured Pseudoflavonifractor sp.]|uniref:pro-sigmaK processing inhibitor BofA family protein n=1 Tax=uncultured Pseudoflavonifractor sp. TaxID=1221379 RepID=UPI0025F1CB36|nr:pro-sigmaK processing inhibitor BofA family protein [uncultured Pseudoflavonifractor sp.]
MESLVNMLPWLLGGLVLVMALAALQKPLRSLMRLLARTGAGLAVLWLMSKVGGLIGVTLGVNLFNALVLGVLGAPGFGLLLMLTWALR